KEKSFQISRSRRLILKVSNREILENNMLNNSNLIFKIRNEINQSFFTYIMSESEIQKSVMISIESSFFENLIIL
ncbi:hypothetical protein EMPG_12540, partial [Blastomyces silverae]